MQRWRLGGEAASTLSVPALRVKLLKSPLPDPNLPKDHARWSFTANTCRQSEVSGEQASSTEWHISDQKGFLISSLKPFFAAGRLFSQPASIQRRFRAYRPHVTKTESANVSRVRAEFAAQARRRREFERSVVQAFQRPEERASFGNLLTRGQRCSKELFRPRFCEDLRFLQPVAPAAELAAAAEPLLALRVLQTLAASGTADVRVVLRVQVRIDTTRQSCRGTVQLPHATGQTVRLAVICGPDVVPEVLAAGADVAGSQTVLDDVRRGVINFDRCITTIDMMPLILPVAKILGPRGLMPNKRSNTIVVDLPAAVRANKAGEMVEYRADADAWVAVHVGKLSTPWIKLFENCHAVVQELAKQANDTGGTADSGAAGGRDSKSSFFVAGSVEAEGLAVIPLRPSAVPPYANEWTRL